MPFPFTFSFSVPGLHNPFSTAAQEPAVQRSRTDKQDVSKAISRRNHPFPPSRCTSPSPSLVPLTRKRGWVPSIPEPSQAATSAASIGGYLDTPAKYKHMVHEAPERATEEMEMFAGAYQSVHGPITFCERYPNTRVVNTMWFFVLRGPRVAHAHGLCTVYVMLFYSGTWVSFFFLYFQLFFTHFRSCLSGSLLK